MLEQAKAKISTEIESNKNNPYIKVVGDFLLNYIDSNPHCAEKVLVNDKSISKSLEAMRKEAEKKKVGNMAVLTDEEGFAVVLKYFDIDGVTSKSKPTSTTNDFDVKLDDFL